MTFHGHSLFKNITELRNIMWQFISIEDSPGDKQKTYKILGGKDEGLLEIRPYATMTEITLLNSTIQAICYEDSTLLV